MSNLGFHLSAAKDLLLAALLLAARAVIIGSLVWSVFSIIR